MVEGIIWALVVLALGLWGIYSLKKSANARLELAQQKQAAAEKVQAVKLLERQNAAALAARTIDETAANKKAELALRTAQANADAAVAAATVQDRIAEEQQIIAARAEGRAAAAKEKALAGASGSSDFAVLNETYAVYRQTGGGQSFSNWLGDIEIKDGSVSRMS